MKKLFCACLYGLLIWSFIYGFAERQAANEPGLETLFELILKGTPQKTNIHLQTKNLTFNIENDTIAGQLNFKDSMFPLSGKFFWNESGPNVSLTASGEIATILTGYHPKSLFVSGDCTLTTQITGAWTALTVKHSGTITGATLDSLSTGVHLENVTIAFASDEEQIVIDTITANDGQGGVLQGAGSIELSEDLPYALSINLDKFTLAKLNHLGGIFSGQLTLSGDKSEEHEHLKGSLVGDSVALALNESKPTPKTVSVTYINSPKPKQKMEKPKDASGGCIALDIEIHAAKNIWITTEDLTSEWKAHLKLQGTSVNPLVYGTLEMIHGNYMTSGKTITIKEGTIFFEGDPIKDSTVSVIGTLDTNSIIAEVLASGPLINPALSLRSNPPLPQTEILSHLIFGRGLADITHQQSKQLKKSIADLKSTSTGSNILDGIRSRFGIDRIEISRGSGKELEDVSVQIGKYLTRSLYVAFDKGITSPANRIILEAALRPNLKLQAELSDSAEGQLHLKWRHDY